MYEYPYMEYPYYECGLLLTTVSHSKDVGIIPVSIGERAFAICLTSPVVTSNREVRLTIKDFKCTNIYISFLIKRTGCPNCKHCKKLTNEDYVEKLKLINPTIKPLEPYTNSNSRIKVLCSVCNSEFYSTPAQLLSVGKVSKGHTKGTGCRVCANRFNSKRLKKSVICIETSMKYDSVLDASNQLGINAKGIASVCRGKRHTAGGYHWKYHDGDS